MERAASRSRERGESLKAGVGGAFSFTLVCTLATIINAFLDVPTLGGRLGLGAALGCGFLFGITYRYVVRADTNAFLRQGAVFAFGLTRAAGAIASEESWLIWGLNGAEGLAGYTAAAAAIDIALARGWLQPAGGRATREDSG